MEKSIPDTQPSVVTRVLAQLGSIALIWLWREKLKMFAVQSGRGSLEVSARVDIRGFLLYPAEESSMNSQPTLESGVPKPHGLTNKEWQELLMAARSSWLYYVFRPTRQVYGWVAATVVVFIFSIVDSHGDILVACRSALCSELTVALVGCFVFFRVLCGSIDWFGKRKLAREIHLIAPAR